MHPHRAVTLMELIIAVSLLGLVFLTVLTLDLFSRRQYGSFDLKTQLQNEASPVLEHMAKNIMQGIGDIKDPGVEVFNSNTTIKVRIDQANTPWNYTDDIWRAYRFTGTTGPNRYQIWYYSNYTNPNSYEILSKKVMDATFSQPDSNNPQLISINITARYDPADTNPPSPENPEVILQTNVSLRSMSVN